MSLGKLDSTSMGRISDWDWRRKFGTRKEEMATLLEGDRGPRRGKRGRGKGRTS